MMVKTVKLEIGHWYESKRGHVFQLLSFNDAGDAKALVHYTGNKIYIPQSQHQYFTEVPEPSTKPGVVFIGSTDPDKKYDAVCQQYPHVVPGSIYKIHNTIKNETNGVKAKKILGATMCKIKCIKCGAIRDIKVQCVYSVKFCEACVKDKRVANAKRYFAKQKSLKEKTKKATKTVHRTRSSHPAP